MNRFSCFAAGLILGGIVVFGSLKYHVVRAEDGVHLIPKISSDFKFNEIYVDIREFGLTDWNEHRPLAAAIVRADKSQLLHDSASGALRTRIDSVLEGLGNRLDRK